MQSTISFILASRDEPLHLLKATLDGLLETSARYRREIIVVDDGSLVPLALERPEVLVVRHSSPVGSSRARRSGASFAHGEVLVFLDPHMSFAPDWLDQMLAQCQFRSASMCRLVGLGTHQTSMLGGGVRLVRAALIEEAANTYFRPPYVGGSGWVGVELSRVDDGRLGALIREAFRLMTSRTITSGGTKSPGYSRASRARGRIRSG